MRQAARCDVDEPARERFGGLVREAGENDLVQPLGLLADGGNDARVPVAMGDDPPRGDCVKETAAILPRQPGALGGADGDHLRLQAVLGEGGARPG